MAYAALASVLHITDEILNSDHFSSHCRTNQSLQSLHDGVAVLLSFLDGSLPNTTQAEEFLVARMRDTAYQAEDVLETYLANRFLADSSISEEQNFELLSRELERVLQSIKLMRAEAKIISDARRIPGWQQSDPMHAVSLSVHDQMGKNMIIGVDEDLLQIKDRLTGQKLSLRVIPIVGMGGIGKTTLAQNLYDDQLIVEHFDVRAWVRVAQEYSAQKILLGLLRGIRVTPNSGDDQLDEYLHKSLKGRRYLLVLDDVWDTKAWDDFRRLFPDDCNGSRVVLTTRLLDVAVYAASPSSLPHQMHLLSDDKSWDLFCQVAFADKQCCPKVLEQSGKTIVKNCQGLPLAVVVIGGLLSKANGTKEYWEYVAENVHSVVAESGKNCLEVLSLSYKHLPHRLKACFVYMAAFPARQEILATRLTRLWISEGLMKPVGSEQMEHVAELYLKDLIDRNLILVREQKPDGKPKTCNIHDLLRDLCVREASNEKFLYVLNKGIRFRLEEAHGYRRLSIHPSVMPWDKFFEDDAELLSHEGLSFDQDSGSDQKESSEDDDALNLVAPNASDDDVSSNAAAAFDNEAVDDSTNDSSEDDSEDICRVMQAISFARSFISTACYCEVSSSDFGSRLVRVVHAPTMFDQAEELLLLPNLRHLSLCYLENIPSSIAMLRNLDTIIVLDLNNKHLPSEIWEMPRIRHLQFNECFLPRPPLSQLVLKSLQTLSRVIDFCSTEILLKTIPNLKTLKIMYEDASDVDNWSQFCLDNLAQLSKLKTLSCSFEGVPNATLMQTLSLPVSLKKLTLRGCRLPWEYMTVVGLLPNLEVLKLQDEAFRGQSWEPNEDEFWKLKFLLIEKSDPSEWKAEGTHFPSLRHLVLRQCCRLQEIPTEVGDIPALETIEIEGCSPVIEASARQIHEENPEIRLVIRKDIGLTLEDLLASDPLPIKKLRTFYFQLKGAAYDFVSFHNAIKSLL